MKKDHHNKCVLTIMVLAVLCSSTELRSDIHGVFLFDSHTDTISSAGQTVLSANMTFEARIVFSDIYAAHGIVFNEWTGGQESKMLTVSPGSFGARAYPVNFPEIGMQAFHSFADGVLHHIAFVYDGTQQCLYVNGTLAASRSAFGSVGNGSGSPHLGAIFRDSEIKNGFIGYLDCLRISNTARYSGSGFNPPTGDLISDINTLILYNFNEEPVGGVIYDESGNNHNGSLGVGFSGATSPEFKSILLIDDPEESLEGDHQYDGVHIVNGGSIVVPPAQWNGGGWEGGWLRLVTDYLYIGPGCSISAYAAGYHHFDEHSGGGPGVGEDSQNLARPPGGGGYGGTGGNLAFGGRGGPPYGSCTEIDYGEGSIPEMGSRGGNLFKIVPLPGGGHIMVINAQGGAGGGGIQITAQEVVIEGILSANGGGGQHYAGGCGGGGGSGGQIVIDSAKVHVKPGGWITANGGNSTIAGGGAGGRILIASNDFLNEGTIEAAGGEALYSYAPGQHGGVCTPDQYCDVGNPVSEAPTGLDLHPDDDTGLDNHDYLTSLSNPRITGQAVPAARIVLYEGSTEIATGSSDSNGSFIIAATLPDGEHTITATAQGHCHSESPQSIDSVTFIIDTTQVPTPNAPDLIEDTWNGGQLLDDDIISGSSAEFLGTTDPNMQVTLYLNGGQSGQCFAEDGNWSLTVSSMSEGYHQATTRLMDIAGNESDTSPALPFVVDLTKPQITNMQATPTDCSPSGTIFTIQANVTDNLSGVNTDYAVDCDIKYANQETLTDVTLNHQGNGSFRNTWDSTGTPAGSYILNFTAYDVAGNRKTCETGTSLCIESQIPFCGDATHYYPQGDISRDCYVNLQDLAALSSHWTRTDCTSSNDYCDQADITQDNRVGLADFAQLTASWLYCTDPFLPCGYLP